MKKLSYSLLAAFTVFSVVGCADNPADQTTDAEVSEAKDTSAATAATDAAVTYTFTDDSTITFVGSKVTGSHEGGFKEFDGSFTVEDGELVGDNNQIVIDMNSTWADHEKLLGHLKSEDFFHIEKFPQSTFTVTNVEKKDDGTFHVTGNFLLHGVEKSITFPADVAVSDEEITMDAEFDINRKDFGIVYPGKPDDLIRDEVVIKLDLTAKPKA